MKRLDRSSEIELLSRSTRKKTTLDRTIKNRTLLYWLSIRAKASININVEDGTNMVFTVLGQDSLCRVLHHLLR